MSFTEWLTNLPEQKQIEVNSNPLVLEIVRDAYSAGRQYGKCEQAKIYRDERVQETLRSAATRS